MLAAPHTTPWADFTRTRDSTQRRALILRAFGESQRKPCRRVKVHLTRKTFNKLLLGSLRWVRGVLLLLPLERAIPPR